MYESGVSMVDTKSRFSLESTFSALNVVDMRSVSYFFKVPFKTNFVCSKHSFVWEDFGVETYILVVVSSVRTL